MSNVAIVLDLALQALMKAQEYQLLVVKANAENRDLTDEEVNAVRAKAVASVDKLEQS